MILVNIAGTIVPKVLDFCILGAQVSLGIDFYANNYYKGKFCIFKTIEKITQKKMYRVGLTRKMQKCLLRM